MLQESGWRLRLCNPTAPTGAPPAGQHTFPVVTSDENMHKLPVCDQNLPAPNTQETWKTTPVRFSIGVGAAETFSGATGS